MSTIVATEVAKEELIARLRAETYAALGITEYVPEPTNLDERPKAGDVSTRWRCGSCGKPLTAEDKWIEDRIPWECRHCDSHYEEQGGYLQDVISPERYAEIMSFYQGPPCPKCGEITACTDGELRCAHCRIKYDLENGVMVPLYTEAQGAEMAGQRRLF